MQRERQTQIKRKKERANGLEKREIQPEILECVLLFSYFQIFYSQNEASRESYSEVA